jgi:hypothetical protein
MIGDLAVVHSHHVDGFKMDFTTRWRDTKKDTLVRSVIRLVSCDQFAVGGLLVNICVKIGEGSPNPLI